MLSGVTVTADTSNLLADAAAISISGSGFDPIVANNSVVFNDGAVGTVTAATSTSLTVEFSTDPTTAGNLTAVVTSNGVSSGAAVQVATVEPVVTSSTSHLAANVATLTINGLGFDPTPGNNTVAFCACYANHERNAPCRRRRSAQAFRPLEPVRNTGEKLIGGQNVDANIFNVFCIERRRVARECLD